MKNIFIGLFYHTFGRSENLCLIENNLWLYYYNFINNGYKTRVYQFMR